MDPSPFRVGVGYDLHRLAPGRRLVMGGVDIPYTAGLVGHSDADVVLHAVIDAMLGAAALPDIGELFPDTDPAYKGADSRRLIREAVGKLEAAGWRVGNVDVTIHAEAPKMSPFKRPMAESIAELVGVTAPQVSVKAKTNEGLGPIGQKEAIACTAVVLMVATKNA